jgi:hypothetical protein
MNLDALHQTLDRLPSVEIRRIIFGQVSDRTDEVFHWDGGRRTFQYRMLVKAILPRAAKFKLLGIDLVDEHGMSGPSP